MCNMAIEAGARAGHDRRRRARRSTTCAGRPFAPAGEMWDRAVAHWRTLVSDEGAKFDTTHVVRRGRRCARRSRGARRRRWSCRSTDRVPDPDKERDATRREGIERALAYMGLQPNTPIDRHPRSTRCSSARARTRASRTCAQAAAVVRGRHVAGNVKLAMVVPGSGPGEGAGRSRGARSRLPRRRLRMARAGMLDVPRDERRPARAGRALRVDVEPQFRRPPGRRRPHASRQSGDGRRRRRRRATSSTCVGST